MAVDTVKFTWDNFFDFKIYNFIQYVFVDLYQGCKTAHRCSGCFSGKSTLGGSNPTRTLCQMSPSLGRKRQLTWSFSPDSLLWIVPSMNAWIEAGWTTRVKKYQDLSFAWILKPILWKSVARFPSSMPWKCFTFSNYFCKYMLMRKISKNEKRPFWCE